MSPYLITNNVTTVVCVFTRSRPSALANGDVQDQPEVDDEQDVSSKQSTHPFSATAKTSIKPEEPQPLVTLTDVKSTHVCKSACTI